MTNKTTSTADPTSEHRKKVRLFIESQWLSRAKTQDYKPGSAKYRRAEMEFFVGAMTALQAMETTEPGATMTTMSPPVWVINMISGRPVVEVDK